MILPLHYYTGYVLDLIHVHLAVAYVSVYRCMCRPISVCIPFNFSPFVLFVIVIFQHYLLQF